MPSTSQRTQLCLRLLTSSSLAAVTVGLGTSAAFSQITIQGSGTVSGTFKLPPGNPNFNQGTTRVNTNAAGQYFRNGVLVYTAPNPGYVGTRADGTHYVDFRGIPVVSTNGNIVSPVLSSGDLQPRTRTGQAGTRLFGTVQDEFVARGFWEGVVTDPATGLQYQGVFEFRGQGPRYSDANGGTSPTVFDFQSHYNFANNLPPKADPNLSFTATAMPVKLQLTVPAGTPPLSSGGNTTPPPPTTGGTNTPPPPPTTGGTNTPPPVVGGGTPAPTTGGTGGTPSPGSTPSNPNVPTPSLSQNEIATVNHVVLQSSMSPPESCAVGQFSNSTSSSAVANETTPCVAQPSKSDQPIGPRSRVLLR